MEDFAPNHAGTLKFDQALTDQLPGNPWSSVVLPQSGRPYSLQTAEVSRPYPDARESAESPARWTGALVHGLPASFNDRRQKEALWSCKALNQTRDEGILNPSGMRTIYALIDGRELLAADSAEGAFIVSNRRPGRSTEISPSTASISCRRSTNSAPRSTGTNRIAGSTPDPQPK